MTTTSASPGPMRKRRKVLLIAGALIVVLLGICVCLVVSSSNSGLTWLTPQQVSDATRPKPFQKLREKLRVSARPLVEWFRGRQKTLAVDLRILDVSTALETELLPGPPAATNADGMKAWILDSAKMAALQLQLTNKPGASVRYGPHFRINDNSRAAFHSGQSVPVGGKYVPTGLDIDLLPTVRRDSINLTVAATSTDVASVIGTNVTIQTNFFAACRVLVPNGGGVIVHCNKFPGASGSNVWMVIRPTIFVPTSPGQTTPALPSAFELGK